MWYLFGELIVSLKLIGSKVVFPIDLFLPLNLIPGPIWFALKTLIFVSLFVWARAAYPRYRYDQLMRLGWKIFLPISLGWVLLTAGILISFNWLPVASAI